MRRRPAMLMVLAMILATVAWGPSLAWAGDEAAEVRRRDEDLARIAALEDKRSLGHGKLVRFAQDPRVEVRRRALRALGRLQDHKALDALSKALDDPDPKVRAEAAFGLGQTSGVDTERLGQRFAVESDAGVKARLIEAVSKQGGAADAPFLLKIAGGGDPALRRVALVGLGLILKRDGKVPGLSAELIKAAVTDPDARVRYGAAYVLMRWTSATDESTFAAVKICAADAEAETRACCVRALHRYGTQAIQLLQAAGSDPDWRVQVEGARGLGLVHAPGALAGLLDGFAAGLAESKLDPSGAALHAPIVALQTALDAEAEPTVAAAARRIYDAAKVGGRIDEPRPAGGRNLGLSNLQCLAAAVVDRAGKRVSLLKHCGAPDLPAGRREVLRVRVLATLPPKKAARAIAKLYKAGSVEGQVAAIGALGPLKGVGAAEQLLLRALAHPDPAVVAEASTLAATWGWRDAIPGLIAAYGRLLPAREYDALRSVFEAFGKLHAQEATTLLEEHVVHPNPALAKAAQVALKSISGADAKFGSRLPPAPVMGAAERPEMAWVRAPAYRQAALTTTKGVIVLQLLGQEAPATVKNFIKLAKKGFYDGLSFHRVVPNFVAQGGDPRGDGWGGPGYSIRCEVNPRPFVRGAVGMALSGKDTGGSQFFITHSAQPHLDGTYTVFASVQSGQEVVDALLQGDRIVRVELSGRPPR